MYQFYLWYLLDSGGQYVGALEVTKLNEIGIAIFERFQRRGCARRALELFMATHTPLPGIPARRNGRWLANVACENHGSKQFFRAMGFKPLQETFVFAQDQKSIQDYIRHTVKIFDDVDRAR